MTTNVKIIAFYSDGIPPRIATGLMANEELDYLANISDSERYKYVCAIVGYPMEYADKVTKVVIEKSTDDE
ncbi:MAG: hypothetical protein NC453_15060 [Muribaculum sp.]|nr:hypothetical protein [Muribaculum sp.]